MVLTGVATRRQRWPIIDGSCRWIAVILAVKVKIIVRPR
jgi:hypothetical protein